MLRGTDVFLRYSEKWLRIVQITFLIVSLANFKLTEKEEFKKTSRPGLLKLKVRISTSATTNNTVFSKSWICGYIHDMLDIRLLPLIVS